MMRHFGPPECPHMIADFEPEIRRIFGGLLDDMKGKTRIDVVDEFAFPGPVTVICKVLGVPLESIPRFHGWIETALDGLDLGPEASDPEQQRRAAAVPAQVTEFRQFLADLFDQYRKQPGPGMFSGMVNDDGPEGRLSQESLVSNAMLMLFAGHETTVNLIAHSVLSLLRHPDALEKLRRRPELIVPGVEELLRFESSVQFWHTRSALEDIEIAGTTIPKGSPIFLCYGSANRDPERFENPDELDLERPTTSTSATARASTTASALRSRGWRSRSRSASSSAAWRTRGSSRTRRRTATTRFSAARATSWSTSTGSATDPACGKDIAMRAFQFVEWQKPPELREVPVPEPGPGQVLVKVAGAGACHSDLHLMEAPPDTTSIVYAHLQSPPLATSEPPHRDSRRR